MDKDSRIKELEEENEKLKEHLKRYTAPSYKKAYYEKNKEKILEKIKSNKAPPEKRKEYNKKSYLKRKEKIKEENQNDEDI